MNPKKMSFVVNQSPPHHHLIQDHRVRSLSRSLGSLSGSLSVSLLLLGCLARVDLHELLATLHAGDPDTLLEFPLGGIHDGSIGLDGRVEVEVGSDAVEVGFMFEAGHGRSGRSGGSGGSGIVDGQAAKFLSEVHFGEW